MRMMDNELENERNKRGPSYAVQQRNKQMARFAGVADNGVPKYAQALFSYLLRNRREMWVVQSEYVQLSAALQNYLLTLHDNAFKPFTILWNKRLRRSLKVNLAFKFASEFAWALDEEER